MKDAAVGADEQRPEIETAVPFEGDEYLDVELNHVVPGYGGEGRDRHEDIGIIWDGLAGGATNEARIGIRVVKAHCGEVVSLVIARVCNSIN